MWHQSGLFAPFCYTSRPVSILPLLWLVKQNDLVYFGRYTSKPLTLMLLVLRLTNKQTGCYHVSKTRGETNAAWQIVPQLPLCTVRTIGPQMEQYCYSICNVWCHLHYNWSPRAVSNGGYYRVTPTSRRMMQ